jgi:hypothetical protein
MCFYVRSLCCFHVSCMCHVRRRVAMLSIMSLLPFYTHTHYEKKKKLHLLCEACCRKKNHGHGEPRSTIVMFATLQKYGYVCHIACSSYKDLFMTMSHYDDRIFASHWNDEDMFITLRQ